MTKKNKDKIKILVDALELTKLHLGQALGCPNPDGVVDAGLAESIIDLYGFLENRHEDLEGLLEKLHESLDDDGPDPTQPHPATTRVWPDTPQGARECLIANSDLDEKAIRESEAIRDPQVAGVWLLKGCGSDTRSYPDVVVYLAGYQAPWGNTRNENDFEECEASAP